MKERVYCLNHPNKLARNAKRLCDTCTKARHEKSAESKGILTKSARNKENIAIFKKKEDGIDNTRRNELQKSNEKIHSKGNVKSKKTKINPISKDKASENAILGAIKKQKIKVQGKVCEMCGKHGEVDLFHIIGVGNKKFATNPVNLHLSCRQCHDIWGDNDWSKIVKFKNFSEIMERLKSLDEGKYWKLRHKIEKHVIEQYFKTGDKTDIERLGIKFTKPL